MLILAAVTAAQEAKPDLSSLPAIAITAYADPEDRIQALSAGYQVHLPKPTDPSVVADSILALTKAAGRG